ncbi:MULTISPECIES: methylglyoxal synthase [Halobacteriovorax]|uniref:Methylglyoxal synthase n=1 Tax=Halobacteriovorax vibrionivorans TaxID=2152716 RepID=A0ABY0IF85_9BACT|nr:MULTISPECIES: methylglyoxal synthase [Halobacteriovorax]AYF43856.1 methylglyoxal synthase [Halobacteriovorax sp. BALOs_7]RZF21610.1 methylglyoxal synthase [Halobacteriovorax vibrionivorans]TGD49097.1 methylglyoxal synthase [Halobacteriovorax sp. Y22]
MTKKTIALVAHDHRKNDLIQWSLEHKEKLQKHKLCATGTTGKLLEEKLGVTIEKFLSGPIGGDFQIGTAIVEGKIDMLIFFWDPLESMAHDPDIKALLRIATLYNIPMACNQTSADFFINSPLMESKYDKKLTVLNNYTNARKSYN